MVMTRQEWYLTGLFDFRSQFAPGYITILMRRQKCWTSNFAAPATLLLWGWTIKTDKQLFPFHLSITARELLVNNDSLAAVAAFGVDSV